MAGHDGKAPGPSLDILVPLPRDTLDLDSDEVLAQILDRGELAAWRMIYACARADAGLRQRIKRIVLTVPVPLPRFWLAALASLGEAVNLGAAPSST